MEIQDIRRRALKTIAIEQFESVAALAKKLNRQQPFLSEVLSGKRSFGEKLARKVEAGLCLPVGALDRAPGTNVRHYQPPGASVRDWPFAIDRQRFAQLTRVQQAKIEGRIEEMIVRFEQEAPPGPKKNRRAS